VDQLLRPQAALPPRATAGFPADSL
jgi:hypothetical protein